MRTGTGGRRVDWATLILLLVAAGLLAVALSRGLRTVAAAADASWELVAGVLPRLLLGFGIAGLLQVLVPAEAVVRWLGAEAGWRGILVGWVAGALAPGGPFVSFPILAALSKAGAGLPALITFLSSWSMLGVNRILVWEIPMMGGRFVAARVLLSLLVPPALGFAARVVWPR